MFLKTFSRVTTHVVRQSWRLNNFVATYHDSKELNNFLPSFILHLTVFICRFVRIGEKTLQGYERDR